MADLQGDTLPQLGYPLLQLTAPEQYNQSLIQGTFGQAPTMPSASTMPSPMLQPQPPGTLPNSGITSPFNQMAISATNGNAPVTTAVPTGPPANAQTPAPTPAQPHGGGGIFGAIGSAIGGAVGDVGKAIGAVQKYTVDPAVGAVGDVITRGGVPSFAAAQQRGEQLTSGSGLPLPVKAFVQTISNPVQLGVMAAAVAGTILSGGAAAPLLAGDIGEDVAAAEGGEAAATIGATLGKSLAVQTGVNAGLNAAETHAGGIPGFRDLNPNQQQAVLAAASILAAKFGDTAMEKAGTAVRGAGEAAEATPAEPRLEEAVNAVHQADTILNPGPKPVPGVFHADDIPEGATIAGEEPSEEGNSEGHEARPETKLHIDPPVDEQHDPSLVAGLMPAPAPTPQPMSFTDKMLNLLTPITGAPKYNEYATPAMRWFHDAVSHLPGLASQHVADSIGDMVKQFPNSDLSQIASAAISENPLDRIAMDGNHFTNLPGNPTLRAVLANLPKYKDVLTPEQMMTLQRIGDRFAPYALAARRLGAKFGEREDVMPGGYYFPSVVDETKEGVNVARRAGAPGAYKSAFYESEEVGEAAGVKYVPWTDAMYQTIQSIGRDIYTRQLSDYFKSITDDKGSPLATTPLDRLNPALAAQYRTLVGQVASVRGRINTALMRAGMNAGRADELDSALDSVVMATPDNPKALVKLPDVLAAVEHEQERAESIAGIASRQSGATMAPKSFRAGPLGVVSKEVPSDAYAIAHGSAQLADALGVAASQFDAALPPDIDRIGKLDTAIRRSGARLGVLRTRGEAYDARAAVLQDELDDAQSQLDELEPIYQKAREDANRTPPGQMHIGPELPALSAYSLPRAMGDVIADSLAKERPATGRYSGIVNTAAAASRLSTSLKFTLGAVPWVGIHGLMLATQDPVALGRAMATSMRALGDPTVDALHSVDAEIRAADIGARSITDASAHGLGVGRAQELAFSADKTGNVLDRVSYAIARAPGVRNFQAAWVSGTNALRREAYLLIAKRALNRGLDLNNDAIFDRIVSSANKMTGYSTNRFGGDIGSAVLYAPRLIQSQVEDTVDAIKGIRDLPAAARSLMGSGALTADQFTHLQAVRNLVQMYGILSLMSAGANYMTGEKVPWQQWADPLNPEFQRFELDGEHWSFLGPWDTLMRAAVALTTGGAGMANAIAHMDGSAFTGNLHSAIDYGVRNEVSPLVGAIWDAVTGTNVMGQKADASSYLQQFMPMDLENLPHMPGREDVSGMGMLAQEAGVKNTPLTPTEQLNAIAQAQFGKQFSSLLPTQQDDIKTKYPNVWQDKVNQMPAATQKYYADRAYYQAQQSVSDQELESGKLSRTQWVNDYINRTHEAMGAAYNAFGAGKRVANPKTPAQFYNNAVLDATAKDGTVDWDKVDAEVASMPQSVQQWVANERSIADTPVTAKYKEAEAQMAQYTAIPNFPGFTGREGDALMNAYYSALSYAGAHYRTWTTGTIVEGVIQLTPQIKQQLADEGFSAASAQHVITGAIDKAVGALPYLPYARWDYSQSHPLLGIFYGTGGETGTLSPKEVQALQS